MVLKSKKELTAAKEAATPVTKKAKGKKLFSVIFFYDWCKSCGLCAAFCAKEIILTDEEGKPYIDDMDSCVGCRFCEIHCPDFAITIKDRHPERRRSDDRK